MTDEAPRASRSVDPYKGRRPLEVGTSRRTRSCRARSRRSRAFRPSASSAPLRKWGEFTRSGCGTGNREETGVEREIKGLVGIYAGPRHVILYTSDGEVRTNAGAARLIAWATG